MLESLYDFTTFLPLIFYSFLIILLIRKRKSSSITLIFLYFIGMFLLGLGIKVSDFLDFHPFWFGHLFIPIEFGILFLYLNSFDQLFFKSPLNWGTLIILLLFQFYISLKGEGYKEYNSITTNLFSLIIIMLSLFRLSKILKIDNNRKLSKIPEFWILLAILLINILDFLLVFLNVSNYYSNNALAFYSVMISRNLLKIIFMLGYIKGVTLINPIPRL